jgi:hypothetical protein
MTTMMGMMISNMLLVQIISASEVKLHVRHWNQWGVNSGRLQLSPTIEYHSPKGQQQSLSNKAYAGTISE